MRCFFGRQDGEISVSAGEEVEVLNRDEDAEWALVRRTDGTTGAIPADVSLAHSYNASLLE